MTDKQTTTFNTISQIETLYKHTKERERQMIEKALQHSFSMLTIKEFIQATGYELEEILPFDTMWHSFHQNIPIYLNDELIRAFGYKGELKEQKKSILYLVEKYKIHTISLENDEYEKFTRGNFLSPNDENTENKQQNDENEHKSENKNDLENNDNTEDMIDFTRFYPELTNVQRKSKPKHILIMPDDLKKIWLVVNTEKGDKIRQYSIALDKLFHYYSKYQNVYKSQALRLSNEKLDKISSQLDTTNNELKMSRTQLEEANERIETLLIEVGSVNDRLDVSNENTIEVLNRLGGISERQVPVDRVNESIRENLWVVYRGAVPMPYMVVRAQTKQCQAVFEKCLREHEGARVVYRLNDHPNPREEFNCFKTRSRQLITCIGNKFRLNPPHTEDEVVALLEEIHTERMNDFETERERVENHQMTASVLLKKKMSELQGIARSIGRGWTKLRKVELVNWILEHA